MYNVFINTHTLNTSAETLKNIQPEKSLETGVDLVSLLPSEPWQGGMLIITALWYYYEAATELSP